MFLFFRRMRAPLIVLIMTYSISTIGLMLIPGVDEAGNPRVPQKPRGLAAAAANPNQPTVQQSTGPAPPGFDDDGFEQG